MTNIGLKPEYIFSVLSLPITNTFFTSVLVTLFLALLSLLFYFQKENNRDGLLAGIQILIYQLLKLTDSVTQDRQLSKKIIPLIATFFLFIIFANLLALIPGFLGSFYVATEAGNFSLLRSPNSDLTTTLALALFAVFAIQFFSLKVLGARAYLQRFFNFTGPVKFILGFFEMISEAVKVLSFSFRLFGNIFAGEILLLVLAFLAPYFIPLPFMILEVFVGVIQALIFAVLTLTFIKTGITENEFQKPDLVIEK